MSDTYNGWTNRETWAVHLYLTNDNDLYDTWQQRIASANRRTDTLSRSVALYIADALKDWWERLAADMIDGNVHRDLRMAVLDIGSLYRVDWLAVSKALIGDKP